MADETGARDWARLGNSLPAVGNGLPALPGKSSFPDSPTDANNALRPAPELARGLLRCRI